MRDPVKAWKYGPVFPTVYQEYKIFGKHPITLLKAPEEQDQFSFGQMALVDQVDEAYDEYDGVDLSGITHQPGTPWHQVRIVEKKPEGSVIPNKLIRKFYQERARSSEND